VKNKRVPTSLAGRGIVAVVLFAGYYVLAFAVAGLLCLVPVATVKLTGGIHWLAFLFFAAAALILWSVVPRPERFKAPGPLLTPESDPHLFQEIFRLARELGQKAPREAYLMPDVTAWVGERGGFMGFGRRRIVGVGLTLLEALSISELRAVLAHEFAHFGRGDTRLGPWIYRTRSTIGRTIQELPALSGLGKTAAALGSMLQRPFVLYGNWFLRITQAISRRQEYLADKLSAETAGRETAASALRKVFMADLSFQLYWNNLLVQALSAGFLPPFAAGFGQYAEFEPHKDMVRKALNFHIEHVRSEPHDSHPSLGERLKALEALPAGRAPEAAPPAVSLVQDVLRRERELFALINPVAGPKLKPIGWDDATAAVLIPHWAGLAKSHQADLAGVTPRDLPDRLPGLAEWGRRMCLASGQILNEEQAENQSQAYAAGVIGVAIVTMMIERGWQAVAGPGQYTVLRLGERSWEPFRRVNALAGGEMTSEDWLKLCDDMGIGDLELGPASPAEEVGPSREQEPSSPPAEAPTAASMSGNQRRSTINRYVLIGLACFAIVVVSSLFRTDDPGRESSRFLPSRTTGPSSPQTGGRGGDVLGQPSSGAGNPFSLAGYGHDLVARVTKWSSGARSYGATVEVMNRSAKTYNFVMVRVEFYDIAGQVVGSLMTDGRRDEYVPPGGLRSITVTRIGRLAFATARASVVYSAEVK
jgi:heat shock protein HtpX